MKTCRRCGIEKPLADFYRAVQNKDGAASYCKPCSHILVAEYHKKHPVKRQLRARAYYRKNSERLIQKVNDWRARNRERVNEGQRRRMAAKKASS